MITLETAERIVELRGRLKDLKLKLGNLEAFNATNATLTLSGVINGYSESGKFPISVKPEVARGMIRAALQSAVEDVLRELRRLNAEIPS